ncbi:hypothetical protein [Ornithinimicrobium cryptoxanthini]|uniref:DUF559 domain-containing protein n=1 Tax=Ornithinimicrobium cryptoxanthini TaxID=2934161 RepID=A0ABY4YHI4_9MICO|nr:hypothetical protein [Ornithinimicrobium cryptoxanthini]USQ75612.1 hypothetical protein NF557_13470 [Ornithinimicrobium cryptoxanthini]
MTFQVRRTGELLADGMTRHRVDQLPRVDGMTGLRVLGDEPQDARLVRVHAAWEKAPTGSVLAGWAAAVVHGVPDSFLDGTVDGTKLRPVDLCVPESAGTYDTRGLRPRRSRIPGEQQVVIDGIRVTNGPRTALDLARWTRTDPRRLAMLDLSARFGLIEPALFATFLDPLGGLHGLGAVRDMVPLVSDRAESVPESTMRHAWLDAGLPSPLVNPSVHDRYHDFVGRTDLFDNDSGLAAEYQGFWHRRDLAPEEDKARRERFKAMNVTVVEIWKKDSDRMQALLREGYERAKARDKRLDSWTLPGREAV